jgi:hypothetical protein
MVTVTEFRHTYSLFLEIGAERVNICGLTRDYSVFSSLMYRPPGTTVK